MSEQLFLLDIFYYFAATAIFVPFFKHIGLGSVLGYLAAGLTLGPYGLGLLHHVQNIHEISHVGIIMLMFVIGLELTPSRISHLKRTILFEGVIQYVGTTALLTMVFMMFSLSWQASMLLSASLTLSSTAFSLSWLKENDRLTKSYGQSSIGILIFQDLIIIPLLMIIPFFSAQSTSGEFSFLTFAPKILLVGGLLAFAKYTLLPVLNKVYETQGKEIFIGSCLMFVLGSSLLMGHLGLSKALGALIAGIFLSGSKIKADIQSFSVPIKSMLMGVFFMGFGLSFDLNYFTANFSNIFIYTMSFMLVKGVVLLGLGYVVHKKWPGAISLALVLSQGGEFGLLAISALTQYAVIQAELSQIFLSCITLSIFLGPFMTKLITVLEARKKVATPPNLEIVKTVEEELVNTPENVVELKKAS